MQNEIALARASVHDAEMAQQGPCGDDDCGVRELLDRLGDKWTILILVELSKGTRRFGELQRAIPGISQRMLTFTTKRLCRDGFVERTAHPTIPPQVDYTITDLGRGLVEMGTRVIDWTRENADTIASARREWDTDNPAPTTARR
ncbi:winged helix-turn-helix transcriptional regulator [Nocardia sp. NPDC055029]